VTREKIMDYFISGNWHGVTTSAVETKIYETDAICERETPNDNNENNGNLRK
jgi:hypothetical protein